MAARSPRWPSKPKVEIYEEDGPPNTATVWLRARRWRTTMDVLPGRVYLALGTDGLPVGIRILRGLGPAASTRVFLNLVRVVWGPGENFRRRHRLRPPTLHLLDAWLHALAKGDAALSGSAAA